MAVYVLDALANGTPVEDVKVDGIELTVDGNYVYHGCIVLNAENIDSYNYS
ncbi:hypothetical protein [Clostridium sp. AM58-1XD]|uniref:hypothetical protein n=1 Tax=Clostridium sp. AM58-1XD TaxID=2292307 RepID=UPI0015F4CDE5|nr:hypothetical protein [Clostridium sp. AM58-1XD]